MTIPRQRTPEPQLSERDCEVLSHLVAAPDQQTAAEWLGITDRHLRRRIDSIMRRLGAETAFQMVVLATLNGFIDPKALPAGCQAFPPGPNDDCEQLVVSTEPGDC